MIMSDIHSKPIAERIDWLFALAHRHGKAFRSPEAWLARERYLSEHPTAIVVLKCMDGRINIPVATHTPTGILMPFRNLGGMFDLGWPYLEWMICLGRGFDFLHTPNVALIIGPYSPDLADPLRKAAGIIEGNMKAGRIPDDGFLLLASVPYDEIGVDRARAELKSTFLSRFAANVIRDEFGTLAGKMSTHTAVLDWRSRSLERIDD
jgi:hypothetical protein